jgi:hypothetical protein
MRPRRQGWVVALVVTAAVAAGGCLALTVASMNDAGGPGGTGEQGLHSPQAAQSASGGSAAQSSGDLGLHSAAPRPSRPADAGDGEQDDSLIAGVGHGGSEQIPTATKTPYRLPKPSTPPKAITAGDVAPAPGSTVTSTSATTSGHVTQLALDATTKSKPADTLAYYQGVFTRLGMAGKSVPAVGGSLAYAFARGTDVVTLTVTPHGAGSHYLIHGVLRAGA